MPVPPEAADAAPLWVQILMGLAGVGSFLGMIAAAFSPKKEEKATTHTVTETVSMADDRPWRDSIEHIEAYLRRIADNSDTVIAMARKRVEEAERRQIRAEERLAAQEEETRRRLNERLRLLDETERRKLP